MTFSSVERAVAKGLPLSIAIAFALGGCAAPVLPSGTIVQEPTPMPSGTIPIACAGGEVPELLVHIASDGATTGEVLGALASDSEVSGTFALVWPAGYSVQAGGATREVLNAAGEVVATDGAVITRAQVCMTGRTLTISEVLPPEPSSSM